MKKCFPQIMTAASLLLRSVSSPDEPSKSVMFGPFYITPPNHFHSMHILVLFFFKASIYSFERQSNRHKKEEKENSSTLLFTMVATAGCEPKCLEPLPQFCQVY